MCQSATSAGAPGVDHKRRIFLRVAVSGQARAFAKVNDMCSGVPAPTDSRRSAMRCERSSASACFAISKYFSNLVAKKSWYNAPLYKNCTCARGSSACNQLWNDFSDSGAAGAAVKSIEASLQRAVAKAGKWSGASFSNSRKEGMIGDNTARCCEVKASLVMYFTKALCVSFQSSAVFALRCMWTRKRRSQNSTVVGWEESAQYQRCAWTAFIVFVIMSCIAASGVSLLGGRGAGGAVPKAMGEGARAAQSPEDGAGVQ